MILGIDANEANVSIKVGISEYALELLQEFAKSSLDRGDITYQIYLKDTPLMSMPKPAQNWHYRILGPKKLWTQWRLPLDLFVHRPRPDVFFSPSHYSPRFSPVPTVMAIMDVSYLHYPELFHPSDLYQLKHWTAYSVRQAAAVMTISHSTRNDIIKTYAIKPEKVHVVYPGIKNVASSMQQVTGMDSLSQKYGIGKNYILFVGTLQPRKNIERLIEAFSHIVKHHPSLELVIVGKKGWLYEPILQAPEKFGVSNTVKFLDYVPDEDLPGLYRHARCYVLPSLYEGFGLPVLEAMKYDCPVITSNVSSLPEAGGDAALYIDPTDVSDIAKTVEKLISDTKLREEMIEKGRLQVKKFSWEKAAKETLDVLRHVAKNT